VYNNWTYEILAKGTVGGVLLTTLIFVGGLIWRGIRIANPQAVMKSWIFYSVLAIGGWVIANLHLRRTRNPQPTSAFGIRPVGESKHPRRFGL